VLLVLNAAPPVKGDEPDAPPQDSVAKLRKQLDALQSKLRALERQRQDDRDYYAEQLSSIKSQLNRIEKMLAQTSDQTTSRRALSFDPNPRTGGVRLKNDLYVPATVTIDGTAYVIRPRATRTLSLPAGPIRYYVTADGFGVGTVKRSEVTAGETFTIRVYDPDRRIDE
jgi:hypothetical protein